MRIPQKLRKQYINLAIKNGMNVLTWDIETSHMIVRTFYIGNNVSLRHDQVKVPNKVISIQYKWAHEKKAKFLIWSKVTDEFDDARNFDDSQMIQDFIEHVYSKADIVIGQNSDSFDIKVLNDRIKALRLPIMEQKPSIDILKLSRKSFRSASHKLDYRSAQQGLGGKISMVDQDWVDIEENDIPATKKMIPYGLKDVDDTETLGLDLELDYYKDLPVAVEKVIYSFLPKNKPRHKCLACEKNKKPKFNVRLKDGKIYCNTCKR